MQQYLGWQAVAQSETSISTTTPTHGLALVLFMILNRIYMLVDNTNSLIFLNKCLVFNLCLAEAATCQRARLQGIQSPSPSAYDA